MKNRLYNVIFPIWFMIIFPTVWIIILPANFIIDSLVLLISLKILKSVSIKRVYKSSIFKVWIFGFISDIIGSLLLILTQLIPQNNDFIGKVINSVALNPFNYSGYLCTIKYVFYLYV